MFKFKNIKTVSKKELIYKKFVKARNNLECQQTAFFNAMSNFYQSRETYQQALFHQENAATQLHEADMLFCNALQNVERALTHYSDTQDDWDKFSHEDYENARCTYHKAKKDFENSSESWYRAESNYDDAFDNCEKADIELNKADKIVQSSLKAYETAKERNQNAETEYHFSLDPFFEKN